ncbi:MAG: 3-oxoacyl-ACP reductase FabG [bacterium]|nr:3-oxoacyl-ACP reductase FabG [bacterium]
MASLTSLEGRIALVTGSTRGIGWSTARMFAEQGATVVLTGRGSQQVLDERVAEIRKSGAPDSIGVLADVSDPQAVNGCFQTIFKTFHRLDILVNNAGILEGGLIGMIAPEMIHRVLSVNVEGMIHNLQAAARLMKRSGGGVIVNLGSIIGTVGTSGQVVYGASKAAVAGITRSAAKELAAEGIRVNAVAPGFIDTEMVQQLPTKEFEERLANIALGRIGTADDVAQAVLFLACDLSKYVTGQVVGVDGGMLI